MPIAFDAERWQKVKETSRLWWSGRLGRPLVQIRLWGRSPGRSEPELPSHHFASFYDLSVPAERIVDRWDYDLSRAEFLGDAFPCIWINFGPGVAAAFMGAELRNGLDTVWFSPKAELEISDIRLEYDPENVWLRRAKDLCRAAVERWQGSVQVGMTDLGGTLDILSTFRPGERLLLDLYDHPEEVKRLAWEIHTLWWRYFEEIDAILRPANPGYTAWTPIFSESPYYMLQCDFSYMIGPRMFDELVRPELQASCRRLANAFYHLDGPGALAHLDSLLSIEELKGIQWVPGAGQPGCEHWPEVYRRIRSAGKLVQVFGAEGILDELARQLGGAEGIVAIADMDISKRSEAEAILERYGAGPGA